MPTTLALLQGSISIDADQMHPNKMRMRGVLVRLDEPSTRPPNGAEGHRIFVPTDVAQKRISTLVGMGLNYAEDMDGHAQRRKVGVIQKAYIKGKDLWVEGIIWKHDFPEAKDDLKQRNLGMSMEIGQVEVADTNADVWVLNDFYFLGATILFRDVAAYNRTQAIAAQADKRSLQMQKKTAVKRTAIVANIDAQQIAAIATEAAVEGVSKHFSGTLARQTKILSGMAGQFEDMNARLAKLEASYEISAADDEDVDDQEATIGSDGTINTPVPRMATKKVAAADDSKDDEDDGDDDEDDDEDIDSEAIDKGDLEDMGPDTSGGDLGTPGQHNEDDENKGSRTTVKDDIGKTVSSSVLSSLRRQVLALTKQTATLVASNKQLKKKLSATSRQVTAAAADTTRRSRPMYAEVNGLLAKAGVDPNTMQASSRRLTVSEVDALIGSSLPNVDVTTRMTLKNKFLEMGLMEEGHVSRGNGLARG